MLSLTNTKNTVAINTATPILAIWTFLITTNASVFKAAICTPNTTNSAIRVPTAAPDAPYCGMSMAFKMTSTIAPVTSE